MPSTDLSIIIKAKDEASAKFKNLGRIIKDTQPSFMALAAGSAAVAGGVTLIGAKAVKMASQFQTGIAEVSTLVNTAEVDMSKLGSAVLDMSKAVPQSAAILTKGLYQVISASVPVSKSMDVLAVASKAATAGLSDTFTAVDSITTIMNAYGMTAEDTTRISDIMFTTVRKGKCITGDTLILQPDGTYLRIDNLLENKDKPLLDIPSIKKVNAITFDEGKFVVTKANWWYRGKKQVKVLTTFSGKQIRTTPEHPYLTAEGWKPVSDLSVGDSIVTPAELPFFGTKNIGIERAELVGMLLGDGAMGCGATTPSISVAEDILIKRIIKLGNRIGLFPVELKYKNAISRVSLRANKTRGGGNKNPFTEWLREIGLMGLNCYEKHIVDDIWTWDKESLRYLLKGLFETDGGLCLSKSTKNKRNAKNLSIAYCSCSEKLSKDIQRLLLKFGIFSTLRHRENLYTYKNNTKLTHSYHVEIKRGQDVRLFLAKITTFDKYPQKTIEFIERLKWIPYEVNRIGQAILEKIISIEDGEVEDVFDLTIDHKESNFVANDIVAHNTTFTELASQIGSVATPAAKAGVRIEEVSAALATMTKKGLDTANATTYLRQIIMSVLKPTSEAAEAADRLGLDFTSAALKSKGLAGFLKDVEEKTKGNSDELVKLFGNVRAFTGALTITGEGAQSFAEDLEAMDNAAGATEEAFGKMMATFTAQWTIFKNVMTTIWIKIGDQLLPVITKLVQSLKGLADGFSNLSNTQAKYIVVIGSIVGAAAGLIAAFSGIMLILPSVIAGVKALGMTLTFLATNPISLAIIAIGAIAAITYGWYKATEDKISQIDKELSQIDTLTKRYNELIAKEERTKEETIELKKISKELNELMPGLIKNTENFSNAQKISAEQVKGHTDKLEAQKASIVETGRGIKAVGGVFVGMGKIIVAAIDSIITQIVNMAIIGGRSFLALLDGAKSVAFAIVNFRRIISGELKLGDVFAQAAKDFGAIGEGISDMRKDAKAGFAKMVDEAADANKKWRDTWAGKPAKAEIEVAGKKVDGGEVTPPPEVTLPLGGGGGLTDEELAKQKKLQEEIIKMNAETKAILLAAEEESYKKRIDIINNEADERTKALERRKAEEPALAQAIDAKIAAIETEREAKILAEKQKLADRTLAIQEETEDTRISLIEDAQDKEKAILEERHQDKIDKIEQELEAMKGQSEEELAIKAALLAQLNALQEEHNAQLDDLEERRKEASQQKWEEEHQIAVGFMNTTQSALATGIASMINGTKSFAEAIKGIWKSIAGFVVDQISQMIAKWILFGSITGGIGNVTGGLLSLVGFQTQPGEWKQVPFDMPAMVHEDELIGRPPFPVSKSPAMTSQPTTIIENHYNISPHFSGIFPNDPEFYREITLTHMVPIIKEANENVSGSILD